MHRGFEHGALRIGREITEAALEWAYEHIELLSKFRQRRGVACGAALVIGCLRRKAEAPRSVVRNGLVLRAHESQARRIALEQGLVRGERALDGADSRHGESGVERVDDPNHVRVGDGAACRVGAPSIGVVESGEIEQRDAGA